MFNGDHIPFLSLIYGVGTVATGTALLARFVRRVSGGDLIPLFMGLVVFLNLGSRVFFLPTGPWDELVNFSSSLLGAVNDLDLAQYPHPALYFNLVSGLYALLVWARALFAGTPFEHTFALLVADHHTLLLVIGRLMSALFWSFLSLRVFRFTTKITGSLPAGLVSLTIVGGFDYLYPTLFSPYSLGALLAFACVEALLEPEGGRRSHGRIGLLWGLAIGSHYLSLLILLPGLVAAFLQRTVIPRRLLIRSLPIAALAFLLANPRILVDIGEYFSFWAYRWQEVFVFDPHAVGRAEKGVDLETFFSPLIKSLPMSAVAFGVLWIVLRSLIFREKNLWPFLAIPLFYYGFFLVASTRNTQYHYFAAPFLAVIGALWLRFLSLQRHPKPLSILVGIMICAWGLGWLGRTEPPILQGSKELPLFEEDPVVALGKLADSASGAHKTVFARCDYLASTFERRAREGRIGPRLLTELGYAFSRKLGRPVGWYSTKEGPPPGVTFIMAGSPQVREMCGANPILIQKIGLFLFSVCEN